MTILTIIVEIYVFIAAVTDPVRTNFPNSPCFPQLFSSLQCANVENIRSRHSELEWDKPERRNPSLMTVYNTR